MLYLKKKKVIRLCYYKALNVGDILNELLIEKLYGIKVKEDLHIKAEMISIGSVLDYLLSNGNISEQRLKLHAYADTEHPIRVWGTGFMFPLKKGAKFVRPVKIYALRGELTRNQVSQLLGKKVRCVLADPGLLASLMLEKYPEKSFDVGIVPHFYDANSQLIDMLQEYYISQGMNVVFIDVKDDPMKVLNQIASCKVILSTSLHGLIIADSFKIPNQWCIVSDKIPGRIFKYQDYYSSFGIQEFPIDLREETFPEIDWIKEKYQIKESEVKKKQIQLLKCFPYKTVQGYFSLFKVLKKKI